MRSLARPSVLVAAIVLTIGAACADPVDEIVDRIVENWRWSNYWFGSTGIDKAYREGQRVSALVFWNNNEYHPIRGLCSSGLGSCLVYIGVYLNPKPRRIEIPANVSSQEAFAAFVGAGFHDSSYILDEKVTLNEFQTVEKTLTLPPLAPPSSILRREIPRNAPEAAGKIKEMFTCGGSKTRRHRCFGSLTFAYVGTDDPYWFVLRSCSVACEFSRESVEMLRRGDNNRWESTAAGYVERPDEVERLKKQIEQAAMLRVQF